MVVGSGKRGRKPVGVRLFPRWCPTCLWEHGLTVDGDVDAAGLDGPDGSRDKEADLTGEVSVFVLFQHLVHQCALDRVEAAGLPRHQHQHVDLYRVRAEGSRVYRSAVAQMGNHGLRAWVSL